MNLENEIITLSNNLRFRSQISLQDIIAHIKFIVDYLKRDTKEISIFVLDDLLSKYKKVLGKEEFETLYGGVFIIKVFLYLNYNFGNVDGFIEDCLKEYLKERASLN